MSRLGFLKMVAVAGLCLAAVEARASCEGLDAKVRAALTAGDVVAMPSLAAAIAADSSCDSAYVDTARRNMALAMLAAGQKQDGSFEAANVEAAAAIARPWQVNMAYGDLVYDQADYVKAVAAYEGAINEIRDVKLVPTAPPKDIELYLAKRAYQAKSLAPNYIASRGFRGEPAGVMVPRFRNFSAVSVPVPIRFATNEADLTPDGQKAVDDLYTFLATQTLTSVTLIGHTDETGTPSYNVKLSKARARTVAAALQAKGLECEVKIVGVGQSQPFEADDRSKYSQDELYSFDRRVEFELGQ
jgi:outer membrane protein OmpA-like peptidoglycan-associated protein